MLEGHKRRRIALKVLKGTMPSESDETRDYLLGVLITPTVQAELEKIAKSEERSMSHVGFALVLRGLEAYQKDGQLGSIHNLPFKRGKPPKPDS